MLYPEMRSAPNSAQRHPQFSTAPFTVLSRLTASGRFHRYGLAAHLDEPLAAQGSVSGERTDLGYQLETLVPRVRDERARGRSRSSHSLITLAAGPGFEEGPPASFNGLVGHAAIVRAHRPFKVAPRLLASAGGLRRRRRHRNRHRGERRVAAAAQRVPQAHARERARGVVALLERRGLAAQVDVDETRLRLGRLGEEQQKQSEAVRSNQKQSKATRSNQKQPEAIRSNQKQSEANSPAARAGRRRAVAARRGHGTSHTRRRSP